jgi:UDP:flavonoid glycosyltransferase YjiC (YdhE family)
LSYLFTLVDGGGTVPPELGAVRRLVERGHHVDVLAEYSMVDELRGTGASFRPWLPPINRSDRSPEHDPLQDWQCKTPLQLFTRMLDRLLARPAPYYAAGVLGAIDGHIPDLVVCSLFAVGAMVGAEAAGIPYDVLMPNIYALPPPGLPTLGLGGEPAVGSLGGGRDRVVTAVAQRQWNKGLGPINQLRNSLGLRPIHDFWDQVRQARKMLVLTSQSFDFPAKLPGNVRYVGPVLDDPTWAMGQPWGLPAGEQPVVLVAMSSTFQDQTDWLQRVIAGLAALPIRGIVTAGPALDPTTFRANGNVTIDSAVPHSEVLKHASLVVTHGGHGTVVRTLRPGCRWSSCPTAATKPTTRRVSHPATPGSASIGTATPRRSPLQYGGYSNSFVST